MSVTVTPALTVSIAVTQHETCAIADDGIINTTVTGGDGGPYTYLWSNGANTDGISGLDAGTYTVTVNPGVCEETASETITVTPAITITSAVTQHESCTAADDGIVNTTVTGGVPPYTYSWSNGANTDGISGLDAGTYTVTVNPGACEETATEIVTVTPDITITSAVTQHESCAAANDGIINTTVTGGDGGPYTYSWSNGANTDGISGLDAGTYTVTVNPGVCEQTASETVTVTPDITITSAVTQHETCAAADDGFIRRPRNRLPAL